jgi:hypothetical protein
VVAYVLDLEGDGLREDLTKIHCIVANSLESNKTYRFFHNPEVDFEIKEFDFELDRFPRLLKNCHKLIGHNIIGYDIPVIEKQFRVDLSGIEVIDTYVLSYLLNPDRQLPEGCPTSTPNPLTGNQDKIGPHSLEALGWPLGYRKIHHHDWRVFSEEMLNRCTSDVDITKAVYLNFCKQLGIENEESI